MQVSTSTTSGIITPGIYTFKASTELHAAGQYPPTSGNGSFEILFTVSPSNIVSTTMSGHITDAHSGLPITGATVQIGFLTRMSDTNGYYSQSNLPPATYTVTASANNYVSMTNAVTTSSSQTNVTQNFALSPLPGLDYFGVGVNWANVSDTNINDVRGDIDATELYYHLRSDLSSICKPGTIVLLDATASSTTNMDIITAQFNQFMNGVGPNDTVVFYVSSHGDIIPVEYGPTNVELDLSADLLNGLTSGEIATMLDSLPSSTRKIVILDTCHAGGVAVSLSDQVVNTAILAASSVLGSAFSASDGTGAFTDALLVELDLGIFDLNRIINDINNDVHGAEASLTGQDLALRDSGYSIFNGLQSQFYERTGFTGNFASNTVTVVQLPPKVSQAKVANSTFQMTLTNVPNSGSIAIEVSTNLITWLQVAFSPAAGTNLNYSFSVTNAPYQFFRTKVVP